ncbi:MAG: SDR family NAD(P)-dependent oxidoreductase [Burkholderiaceae bacterium]|nr:SDR family NAD(P)-dependent oxidoreductase [Burkholderiaceae bacterium]
MLPAMTHHLLIVTGSSRGLGAALVRQRLLPGWRILGLARQANAQLQAQADAAGLPLLQWTLDLADPLPAAQRLQDWLQGLDSAALQSATLINNAGVVGLPAPLQQVPLATLSGALRAGLEATLLLSAAFLAATEGWSAPRRLMNISSGLGRRAMAGSATYCAAKAGMDHLSRALALEQAALGGRGARIESIAPGVIDTDMQAELRGADARAFPERERFAALKSAGQLMSADDCAARLLRHLDSAQFGRETISDIREI